MAGFVAAAGAGGAIAEGELVSQRQHQGFAFDAGEADIQDVRQAAGQIAVDPMLDRFQVGEQLLADCVIEDKCCRFFGLAITCRP